ncbi:hypothetical protein [Paenibacillus sp. FSL L8-0709]|uniref:hypothetical protein n=1 Tax=Paenibacillus sp. FSL L8-0709 TaxID=2975312 RepID=UPI0030FA62B5
MSSKSFNPSNKFCKYGKGSYFFSNVTDAEAYIKLDIRKDGHLLEVDIETSTFYKLNSDNFAEVLAETNTTNSMVEAKQSQGKLSYMGTD